MTWRSMIRMRAGLPLATAPCGEATGPMPGAGQVIAGLGLWQRPLLAEAASSQLELDGPNRQGVITSRGRELQPTPPPRSDREEPPAGSATCSTLPT